MQKEDLISRRAAIEALGERPLSWTDSEAELAEGNQWDYDYAAIEAVPAVDAVPVVRCVDCKYCRIWEGHAPYVCECRHMNNIRKDALHKADHFCGYGERREGDGDDADGNA